VQTRALFLFAQRPNKRRALEGWERSVARGIAWALAQEYGFTGLDGTRPHWGNHARKKYGKYNRIRRKRDGLGVRHASQG